MPSSRSIYALILAGGSGTRFWPLSRNEKPKQLLALFDEETLIEKAVNRLDGLVKRENILILTNQAQAAGVRAVFPDLPEANIVAEPARRDTAPAIALAAGWIAARDPEAVMIALPADQLVTDSGGFREILSAAAEAADCGEAIVTLGIRPDWACPGYGYIERGEVADLEGYQNEIPVVEVKSFREKPSPEVAEEFLKQGNFSWNAGIFIWTIPTLLKELSQHCPELSEFILTLQDSSDFSATVAEKFPHLSKTSIDYALMENAANVLNIEADVGWDDVGGWNSVGKYLQNDEAGNAHRGDLTAIESGDNVVFSTTNSKVALLGVSDLIVVQTEDALLVARKEDADKIKALVDELPENLL